VRKLLIGLAAAIALLIVAAFLAPLFVPSDFVKHQIAQRIAARTGREFRIDGPLRFSLLPRLEITADDVSLANAEGGVAAHLIEVNRVDASFRFLPLLGGRLVADRVELIQPQLHAEIDKNGRPNWLFRAPTKAEAGATPGISRPNISFAVAKLHVISGILNYLDQRGGKQRTVPNISLDAALPNDDGSADAVGSAAWNGQLVKFTAHAASFEALRHESSDLTLNATSGWADFDFKGNVSLAGRGKARGAVSFKSPSLSELFEWLGVVGRDNGIAYLSPVSVEGTVDVGPQRLSLIDATVLGPVTAKGGLSLERNLGRPIVRGSFALPALDLDAFLQPSPPAASPAAPRAPTAAPGPRPQTPQTAPPAGATPVFMPRLGKVEWTVSLSIDALRFRRLTIGKTYLDTALNQPNGRSLISIGEMALYGGQASGDIFIDAKPTGAPGVSAKLKLTQVDTGPLLQAITGSDVLTGRGDLTADLRASGNNTDELLASLNGSGHVALANGIWTGALVQPGDIVLPRLGNNGQSPSAQLPYDSFSTDFAISHSVLTTKGLKLSSPKMSATGDGEINLSPCRVDYRWLPVIPGKGSAQIAVTGPCDAPTYRAMTITITPHYKK
jgi:AsmA protein